MKKTVLFKVDKSNKKTTQAFTKFEGITKFIFKLHNSFQRNQDVKTRLPPFSRAALTDFDDDGEKRI